MSLRSPSSPDPADPGDRGTDSPPRRPLTEAGAAPELVRRLRDAEAALGDVRARLQRSERLRRAEARSAARRLSSAAAAVALAETRIARHARGHAPRAAGESTAEVRRILGQARALCGALSDALEPPGSDARGAPGASDEDIGQRLARERAVRRGLALLLGRLEALEAATEAMLADSAESALRTPPPSLGVGSSR